MIRLGRGNYAYERALAVPDAEPAARYGLGRLAVARALEFGTQIGLHGKAFTGQRRAGPG